MNEYKESVSKLSPPKLVNVLLKLNEELAKAPPEDVNLKTTINAKIVIVQELISKLKTDITPAVSLRGSDSDKLERSKAGHLAQITVLYNKFETEFDKFETALEEDDRSEILVTLDQISSSLSCKLVQVEHKLLSLNCS